MNLQKKIKQNYEVEVECYNCAYKNKIKIKKSIAIFFSRTFRGIECKNCGGMQVYELEKEECIYNEGEEN